MPAYRVIVPNSGGQTLVGGADGMIIFATDATAAKAAAAAKFDQDSNSLWAAATATEIVAGAWAGWTFNIRCYDLALEDEAQRIPQIDVSVVADARFEVETATVVAGGIDYDVGDEVYVTGAEGDTLATFLVATVDDDPTEGVVVTLTKVSSGSYAATPDITASPTTTNGGGTGLTLDLTVESTSIEGLGYQLADTINDEFDAVVGGTASFNPSTNVLTIAGSGQNIGDWAVEAEIIPPWGRTSMSSLVSTIVHRGSAAAALSVALAADAAVIPSEPVVFKTIT